MNDPKPKPPIISPLTSPFLAGKYSQLTIIGHMYDIPIPTPYRNPYKNMNSGSDIVKVAANTLPTDKMHPIRHHSHGGMYLTAIGPTGVNVHRANTCTTNTMFASSNVTFSLCLWKKEVM